MFLLNDLISPENVWLILWSDYSVEIALPAWKIFPASYSGNIHLPASEMYQLAKSKTQSGCQLKHII